MTRAELQGRAEELVEKLEEWQTNKERGILARLRRGLSETTRCEAWTVLGPRFGRSAIENPVYYAVAGCFALYPFVWDDSAKDDTGRNSNWNFGWTFREVRLAEPKGEEKMRSEGEPHTRFRRLLACSDTAEICRHIPHAVRLAKSRKTKINYRQLFLDLWWWNHWRKIAWAKAYWDVPPDAAFALAGAGVLVEEEPVPMPE
jgi:CRISPR type I-E-associated protein CasB/Cse2